MKDIKLILAILVLSMHGLAQQDTGSIRDANPRTLKKLGKSALKQDDPSSAIPYLEAYRRKEPAHAAALSMLGRAYMEIRDYDRAQRAFLAAYQASPEKSGEALYYHAQMQKSNGRYDSAKIMFQKFAKEYKGSQKQLKRQARKEMAFCDSVQPLLKTAAKVRITRLDSAINKVNSEGAPLQMDDNTILFSSLRTEKREFVIEDDYSRVPYKKMYYARRVNGRWQYAGEYRRLNEEEANTGSAALSADRKRLYFTRCSRNISGRMICAIYVMEKTAQGWGEAVKLPKEINHPRYTAMMPAVATDPVKNNDVIYFVSNRPGGKGGYDIWSTTHDRKKNIFKKPRNAGSKVNTGQDELSPFFDNETRTLYFSSDGHGGLGGFDVLKALGDGRRFTGAQNIGAAINSGADELYYTIGAQRNEGFFASNRKGGSALPNATCCDDLYEYKFPEYESVTLEGDVMDMINPDMPVNKASVDIYIKDKTSGDRFYVKSTSTDSSGSYRTALEPEQDYFVVIRRKDVLGVTEEVSTKNLTKGTTLKRRNRVVKKPKGTVTLKELNYEFNRADLTPAQKAALDQQLIDMMKANPEVIIEVQSHTDSKGSDALNQKLSQRRADNIVLYAISRGIDPARIKAMGYGESQPVAPNTNPDGSDNPVNRAKNRRTEFKIIGIIETEEPEVVEESEEDVK